MNEVLNKVFEASSKLELTQELIGVLIDKVESRNIKTQDDATLFASQQNTIGALLHIALDYVFDVKVSLEKLQD